MVKLMNLMDERDSEKKQLRQLTRILRVYGCSAFLVAPFAGFVFFVPRALWGEASDDLAFDLWVFGTNVIVTLGVLCFEEALRRELRFAVLFFEMEAKEAARQLGSKVARYSAAVSVLTGASSVFLALMNQTGGGTHLYSPCATASCAVGLWVLSLLFLGRAVFAFWFSRPRRDTTGHQKA